MWNDVRYAVRGLSRSRGFAAVAILTMTLGIGATTAVFSVLHAVLLRSLPYGDAERLVYIWTPMSRMPDLPRELSPSFPDYYDWTRLSRSFTSLAAFDERYFGLESGERIGGARVSGNFFETLRVTARMGRAEAVEGRHEAVISDALWRSRFASDRAIIGRAIRLDRTTYTVAGVMPPRFSYPHATDFRFPDTPQRRTDIWVPLDLTPRQKADREVGVGGTVVARLKDGVTVRQAQAEMASIEAQLDSQYPPEIRGWSAFVQPLLESTLGPVRGLMWLLMTAVAAVLAICCANVANLLLGRSAGRRHEIGVRAAMGAGRAHLVRQMLAESLLLAACGGAAGVALGSAATRVLVRLAPATIPRIEEASFDWRVLLFALSTAILTGLIFGLAPALAASRVDPAGLLASAGRGKVGERGRLRSGLIVSEMALALVLVAVAGLLLRSFQKISSADFGFARSTLTMRVAVDDDHPPSARRRDFFLDVARGVRQLPGVAMAGIADDLPLGGHYSVSTFSLERQVVPKGRVVGTASVSAGFCESMQMRLLAGRLFADADMAETATVAVISRGFRDLYFPARNPLGHRMRFCDDCTDPWYTIVGVVDDVRHGTLEETPRPAAYVPLWRTPNPQINLAISSLLPPERIVPAVREVVRKLDPTLAISDVRTMAELVTEASAARRFQTALVGGFAGLAIVLAAVGLYGLMAYAVQHRTQEIGVRMAVGAGPGTIVAMVLRQGMTLAAMGLAIGLAGAAGATRLIGSWLYGVRAYDPVTWVAVPVLLLAVAGAACVFPARKASQVDPVAALRE